MIVSFTNIKPVAIAGPSQSAIVGASVTLDGSGSSDANGDPLSYAWTLNSASGSTSRIADTGSIVTTFVPDVPGLYLVQLTVNDGFVKSDPSTIQVQVISQQTATIERVREIQSVLTLSGGVQFRAANMKNALLNTLNAVIACLTAENYAGALGLLEHDVLTKTDGCGNTGAPDKNDWIIEDGAQGQVYARVLGVIEVIRNIK